MTDTTAPTPLKTAHTTTFAVLFAISFSHLLNDMLQAVLPAIYPNLQSAFHLSFEQIGLITLAFQCTASLFQPAVGFVADIKPMPYSLALGMVSTLAGLVLLSMAGSYFAVLVSAILVGLGSSVFHPESSRVARMASGGRHGLAQSLFQVGGNTGSALGPLTAAFVVAAYGQRGVAWYCAAAVLAIVILFNVGTWYKHHGLQRIKSGGKAGVANGLPRGKVATSIAVLLLLIFSKYFYLASITSYFTFYLIHTFNVSVQAAQVHLFLFLGAVAAGTFMGGPLGDRFGRKIVIWFSILGMLPFTLMLPYANLFWTGVLSVIIGVVMASAFPAIIVYAQELLPGKLGMISGLFYGFAFGMGGIGAAALGTLADATSITFVYKVCAYLPMIGLLAVFLPNLAKDMTILDVEKTYAVAVSPHLLSLIDPADPADPIARQFLPSLEELVTLAEERADPIGDAAHSPVPGIVHRHPDRVLFKAVAACPVYCRFCFRRETIGPGKPNALSPADFDQAVAYIAAHPQIWEVILTGGDPFILSPRRVAEITRALADIAHVKIVRWHTRVPVTDPERITDDFAAALLAPRATSWVAVHANHPKEFAPDARRAIARLADAGIPLVSQSVLLRGVNDDVETLDSLMRLFVENRIKPYYLHHPDLAPGTSHFRLGIDEGLVLVTALRARLSGLAMPAYMLDIPGGFGKVPLESHNVERTETGHRIRDGHGTWHDYPSLHPA